MNFKKLFLTAVTALCGTLTLSAQSFEWDLRFDTNFDNHEKQQLSYLPTAVSLTMFSSRLMPVVGIGWDDGEAHHRVMAGGSYIHNFNLSPSYTRREELLLYYNYSSPRFSIYAGKFERRRLVGSYPRAIYSGMSNFYDNVVDGFALQHRAPNGRLEAALDWDGMQSGEERESFRVLSAGETIIPGTSWLTAGYGLDWYHLANRVGSTDGVVDHITLNPWVGVTLARIVPWFDLLFAQAGWMGMMDRDRVSGEGWHTPGGVNVDVGFQKWKVGIRNRLYTGGRLMPLWDSYGNRLYKGDSFYASVKTYNYTQIYWRPTIGRGVDLSLELVLHSDGRRVGFEHTAAIGVSLNKDFFKKR
jgi:hypothetical protein